MSPQFCCHGMCTNLHLFYGNGYYYRTPFSIQVKLSVDNHWNRHLISSEKKTHTHTHTQRSGDMYNWTSFIQVMACNLFSAKPLPALMVIYFQLNHRTNHSKIQLNFFFNNKKMVLTSSWTSYILLEKISNIYYWRLSWQVANAWGYVSFLGKNINLWFW